MKELIIEESISGQRLDKFLKRYLPGAGSGFIYKMLRKKNIVLNGKKAEGSELLAEGDSVGFYFSDATFESLSQTPDISDFPSLKRERIVYEDENILLYNKEAGLLCQTDDSGSLSLCEYLIGYLFEKGELSSEDLSFYRPSVVNRIDRNTTGLVVCAKKLASARELSEMIKYGFLIKEYLCVCKGHLSGEFVASGWMVKNSRENKVYFTEDESGVKASAVFRGLCYNDESDLTLVHAKLLTGKTHQLRALLARKGYPIVGDRKYSGSRNNPSTAFGGPPPLSGEAAVKASPLGEVSASADGEVSLRASSQLLHSFRITFPPEGLETLDYLSGRSYVSLPDFIDIFPDISDTFF